MFCRNCKCLLKNVTLLSNAIGKLAKDAPKKAINKNVTKYRNLKPFIGVLVFLAESFLSELSEISKKFPDFC